MDKPKSITRDLWFCKDCGSFGKFKKKCAGSIWMEILLWCCFAIPGFIYSLWRLTTKKRTCDNCKSISVIPASSPMVPADSIQQYKAA